MIYTLKVSSINSPRMPIPYDIHLKLLKASARVNAETLVTLSMACKGYRKVYLEHEHQLVEIANQHAFPKDYELARIHMKGDTEQPYKFAKPSQSISIDCNGPMSGFERSKSQAGDKRSLQEFLMKPTDSVEDERTIHRTLKMFDFVMKVDSMAYVNTRGDFWFSMIHSELWHSFNSLMSAPTAWHGTIELVADLSLKHFADEKKDQKNRMRKKMGLEELPKEDIRVTSNDFQMMPFAQALILQAETLYCDLQLPFYRKVTHALERVLLA